MSNGDIAIVVVAGSVSWSYKKKEKKKKPPKAKNIFFCFALSEKMDLCFKRLHQLAFAKSKESPVLFFGYAYMKKKVKDFW